MVLEGQMDINDYIEKNLDEILQEVRKSCLVNEKKTITETSEYFGIPTPTIRNIETDFALSIPRRNDKKRNRYYTVKEWEIIAIIKFLRSKNQINKDIESYLLKKGYIQRAELVQRKELTVAEMTPQNFLQELKMSNEKQLENKLQEFEDRIFRRFQEQLGAENQKWLTKVQEMRDKELKELKEQSQELLEQNRELLKQSKKPWWKKIIG